MVTAPEAEIDFATGAPVGGVLPERWIHGSPAGRPNTDPPIQVHRYDAHTFVLRQNKSVHYEAPFLYLLFGNDRVLLLDTGATADPARFPLRATVDDLVESWLAEHPRSPYPLVVAHSHGHSDHVAADPQFAGRPDTTIVGTDPAAVRSFFGLPEPPQRPALPELPELPERPAGLVQTERFDLGGRVLEVIGIPGHEAASIAMYDPWTGFLLTGDTVYRGRLYVEDIATFVVSLDTLMTIAQNRPVTQVMGCHIEMTRRPGRDYPIGATYQPDEPVLQMTVPHLTAVRNAALAVADRPGVHAFDDFLIFNGRCRRAILRSWLRGRWSSLRNRTAGIRGRPGRTTGGRMNGGRPSGFQT